MPHKLCDSPRHRCHSVKRQNGIIFERVFQQFHRFVAHTNNRPTAPDDAVGQPSDTNKLRLTERAL